MGLAILLMTYNCLVWSGEGAFASPSILDAFVVIFNQIMAVETMRLAGNMFVVVLSLVCTVAGTYYAVSHVTVYHLIPKGFDAVRNRVAALIPTVLLDALRNWWRND